MLDTLYTFRGMPNCTHTVYIVNTLQSLPGRMTEHQHLAHHALKFISNQSGFGNHQLHPHATHVYYIYIMKITYIYIYIYE